MSSNRFSDLTSLFKRQLLKSLLNECGGQQKAVAEILQLDHSYLSKLTAEYGLDKDGPKPVPTHWAVVSRSGFLVGFLDADGCVDGKRVPELGDWFRSGRLRLVAGKSLKDLKSQGVAFADSMVQS